MSKTSIQEAENRIRSDLEVLPETRDACLRLLTWLLAQPLNTTKHLTFSRLQDSAQVASIPALGGVLNYLTGARLPLLEIHYELIDGDSIIPVEANEILNAERSGNFYHPLSGDALQNFESRIFVHFEFNDKMFAPGIE